MIRQETNAVKVSKFIINFFKTKNIKTFFVFQGGAIMNLINEIGNDKNLNYVIPHHEQALSMQVDTFARLNGYGVGMVTSGPGATNILTGLCSAYYDSIPCFFITGQVGQIHLKKNKQYRQFGFQETDVVSIFKSVTKYTKQITNASNIKYELEKAYYISNHGRPGPVLLDIPFNIQIKKVNPIKLRSFKFIKNNEKLKSELVKLKRLELFIKKSEKPLLLIGGGIKTPDISKQFLTMIEKYKLPFVTTWKSQDFASSDHVLNIGSIGKNGHRSANYACEAADLIITLGQRFAVKNIFGNFAKNAKIVAIDIDKQELKSPLIKVKLGINLSLNNFLLNFRPNLNVNSDILINWRNELSNIKNKLYEITIFNKNKNLINPFLFIRRISQNLSKNHILHIDIGAHQTWFFQSFLSKNGQKFINHCGHGAMGHAICSAVAGYYSKFKKYKQIVFIGDGGFMMNVQELNYIRAKKIPIKIIVLNNSSLGNTFLGTLKTFKKTYGNDECTGYTPPNIKSISNGFNIKYFSISNNFEINKKIREFLKERNSAILDIKISKYQDTAELDQIKSLEKIIYQL